MIRVSLAEVAQTVTDGGRGLGLPPGQAAGLGAAAVWLCSMGLNGCQAALCALWQVEQVSRLPEKIDTARTGEHLVFRDDPLAYSALAACDMAVAGASDGPPSESVIDGCDSPLLVLGYAGVAADRCGAPMLLSASGRPLAWTDGSRACVTEGIENLPPSTNASVRSVRETPRIPTGIWTSRAWDGHRPAQMEWDRLKDYAALSRVKSSESSRLTGAGAGSDEPD